MCLASSTGHNRQIAGSSAGQLKLVDGGEEKLVSGPHSKYQPRNWIKTKLGRQKGTGQRAEVVNLNALTAGEV